MSKAVPAKRGRKDNDSDAGTDDLGVVGTFETLRDEGEHFVHVKQYEKAIESFTKALEMKSEDKTCLVIRSKCYLMLGNAEKALADAEAALGQEEDGKKDIKALNMKAEALYQKGDFENALVFYHRGNKLRPELQEFRLGIQKCEEAIDNSIGDPVSVQLEATGDLSYFYKQNEKKPQKGYTKVPQPQKKEEKKERQRPQDNSRSKTTKELLGELYQDKEFLEKLFDGLSNNNNGADDYIKGRACDGLEYLNSRSDFWRQQKPMYARLKDQRKGSGKASSGQPGGDNMKYVLAQLEKIDKAQSEGRYQDSLDKCKLTMKRVENMPEESLKNKPSVIANLCSSMGTAYLEQEKFKLALQWHQKDLDLAQQHSLEEAESRALDNLGRVYAKMGDYQKAVEIWLEKLPKSKIAVEKTWLCHEIGRCYLEMGNFSEAKNYGEQSLTAAKEADDVGWQLHATVLVAQSEHHNKAFESASNYFTQALELAEEQNDKEAQSAIKKALQEVNDKIVEKDNHDPSDNEAEDNRSTSSDKEINAEKSEPEKEQKKSPAQSPTPSVHEHKTESKVEDTDTEEKEDKEKKFDHIEDTTDKTEEKEQKDNENIENLDNKDMEETAD